ncbi:MAG: hypothetical protein EOM11_09620 [Erysipelotrichia bacterium]|nr:hypothetical protein [Erysipelotrichia bacterium]
MKNLSDFDQKILSKWNFKKALIFVGRIKDNQYLLKMKSFTGIKTLFRIKVTEPIEIHIKKSIDSGSLSSFLVTKDQYIKLESEMNQVQRGKYRFRVLGEHVSGQISIERKYKSHQKSVSE